MADFNYAHRIGYYNTLGGPSLLGFPTSSALRVEADSRMGICNAKTFVQAYRKAYVIGEGACDIKQTYILDSINAYAGENLIPSEPLTYASQFSGCWAVEKEIPIISGMVAQPRSVGSEKLDALVWSEFGFSREPFSPIEYGVRAECEVTEGEYGPVSVTVIGSPFTIQDGDVWIRTERERSFPGGGFGHGLNLSVRMEGKFLNTFGPGALAAIWPECGDTPVPATPYGFSFWNPGDPGAKQSDGNSFPGLFLSDRARTVLLNYTQFIGVFKGK